VFDEAQHERSTIGLSSFCLVCSSQNDQPMSATFGFRL
jgi:hypothetical protein